MYILQMPTFISFEINNTTHTLSFTDNFTSLEDVHEHLPVTGTLSPTTVDGIEFNATNTFSTSDFTAMSADQGFGVTHFLFMKDASAEQTLQLSQEQGGDIEVRLNGNLQGSAQIHDGTAGASGDPFVTPLFQ